MLKEIRGTERQYVVEHYHTYRDRLVMDQSYQRGHVWGVKRQQNFIKSLLRGLPVSHVVIVSTAHRHNKRTDTFDDRLIVIDGKQRITALLKFFDDQLQVPGHWFGIRAKLVTWSQLPLVSQRRFRNSHLSAFEADAKNEKEEVEIFNLINFGGLAQGEVDDDKAGQSKGA